MASVTRLRCVCNADAKALDVDACLGHAESMRSSPMIGRFSWSRTGVRPARL